MIRGAFIIAICLPLFAVAQPVVPGFDRFPRDTPAAQIAAGEVLITELNCVACHAADEGQAHRFQRRPAPTLFTTHNPGSAGWLRHWLLDPQKLKPGTLMPDLLHGLDKENKPQAVDALRHYLVTLNPVTGPEAAMIGDGHKGKQLYRTLGCAQCHAPDALDNKQDIPLGNVRYKYGHAHLIKFLRDPLHSRPAGRMPRTPMSEEEAAHLSVYLRQRSGPLDMYGLARGPAALKLRAEGKQLVQTLRCANCHQMPKQKDQPAQLNFSKPLSELNPTRGCLAPQPVAAVPQFHLNAAQRTAITAALRAKDVAPSLTTHVHRELRLFNCTACHDRKAFGGPNPQRDNLFHSLGEDLGDEGRLPPTLTGVGAKLTESALHKVLRGEGAVRPYLATRMPDFGEANAKRLTQILTAADARANVKPTPRHGTENKVGRNKYGRDLMGVQGLNCITCHQLAGHKSLGIQALDLAHAPSRLRPEWFRDYLINPAAFRPGTRMPSFWPEGKAVSKIFGSNTERQIDSIWVYLNELEQTRLPEGLEKKGGFELKPDKQPIVFRTFMEGAGTHAIAIGFPAGVHAAFDSEAVGWTTLWRGKFLDAESTWDDRFTPLAKPLGTDLIKLPSGPAVAVYQDGKPWPKGELQFRGYRLAKNGTPTFLYRHGKIEITDTLTPQGKGMQRRMEFTGGEGELAVRLAVGEDFQTKKLGQWIVDKHFTVITPTVKMRTVGKQMELHAPVKLKANGKTVLEVELQW
ncbi:MAG: c-type cytochrome [Verrucomicrobia subdivision 3 bacterium]|nr:c-type cytochrome [Limisphaerales bacterium]